MIFPCDFLEARTSLFMVVYVLFCIFLLLLTEIECFLCMFAGNLREFIYMGISDEKLWESCLKGDKEAFRELYCRFYALLRNYGIKLLPDKNLVEDCVQDIFIKLIHLYQFEIVSEIFLCCCSHLYCGYF